jgi:hypothetical protein
MLEGGTLSQSARTAILIGIFFLSGPQAIAKAREHTIAPLVGLGTCLTRHPSGRAGYAVGLEFQSQSANKDFASYPFPDPYYIVTWPLYKYFDLFSFDIFGGEFRCRLSNLGDAKLKITGGLTAQWGNKHRLSATTAFIWKFGVGGYGATLRNGNLERETYVSIIAPTASSGVQYRHSDHLFSWLGLRYMHLLPTEKIEVAGDASPERFEAGLLMIYLQSGYIF